MLTVSLITNAAGPLRIMPLGDSETYGWEREPPNYTTGYPPGKSVSYRLWLWKKFQERGIAVDFVGPLKNGKFREPDTNFDQEHAGISGAGLSSILSYLKSYSENGAVDPGKPLLKQFPADIVLLHIGTNDVREYDPSYPNPYDEDNLYFHPHLLVPERIIDIFDYIYSKDSNGEYVFLDQNSKPIKLYIAKILGNRIQQSKPEQHTHTLNEAIDSAYKRFASDHPELRPYIKVVDIHSGAGINYNCRTATSCSCNQPYDDDGNFAEAPLHPIESGFKKMADTWFDTIMRRNTIVPIMSLILD